MFVSSPIKWIKVCLIKWREISLDMQKPFLLKIQISIFIHVFFLSQALFVTQTQTEFRTGLVHLWYKWFLQ